MNRTIVRIRSALIVGCVVGASALGVPAGAAPVTSDPVAGLLRGLPTDSVGHGPIGTVYGTETASVHNRTNSYQLYLKGWEGGDFTDTPAAQTPYFQNLPPQTWTMRYYGFSKNVTTLKYEVWTNTRFHAGAFRHDLVGTFDVHVTLKGFWESSSLGIDGGPAIPWDLSVDLASAPSDLRWDGADIDGTVVLTQR